MNVGEIGCSINGLLQCKGGWMGTQQFVEVTAVVVGGDIVARGCGVLPRLFPRSHPDGF